MPGLSADGGGGGIAVTNIRKTTRIASADSPYAFAFSVDDGGTETVQVSMDGDVTVTLPTWANWGDRRLFIERDGDSNTLTVGPNGSTINGQSGNQTIAREGGTMSLSSNGTTNELKAQRNANV